MPPRAAKPVNENVTSVGAAQFIPRSWHMVLAEWPARLFSEPLQYIV
jgi:hypothetical protein